MKRKLMLLTLIVMLLVAFTACESDRESDDKDEDEIVEVDKSDKDSDDEDADADKDDDSDEGEFVFGVQEDNVYENEYLGIGCELDDEWTFLTEEEINEANNVAADVYDNTEAIEYALENNVTLYDVMASADMGLRNFNITVTNLEKVVGYNGKGEKYIDDGISNLKTLFESIGAENVSVEADEIEFLGEDCKCAYIQQTVQGMEFYQLAVYFVKDNYVVNITSTVVEEGTEADILDAFYKVD